METLWSVVEYRSRSRRQDAEMFVEEVKKNEEYMLRKAPGDSISIRTTESEQGVLKTIFSAT